MIAKAVIDSRSPASKRVLWGLTLTERNVRKLAHLGVKEIVVLDHSSNPSAHRFDGNLPADLSIRLETTAEHKLPCWLQGSLTEANAAVLLVQGEILYDTRILARLLESDAPCGAFSDQNGSVAAAALVDSSMADLLQDVEDASAADLLYKLRARKRLKVMDLSEIDPYLPDLRRTIPPFMIRVESDAEAEEADRHLRMAVQKGTNDLVAKFIHPRLEFGLARLLAGTSVTPNTVTCFNILLSVMVVYCFATGALFVGLIIAALKGLLDGVDGKLARLTLNFSRNGDLLDHISDTVFDALWYLALGWHFSAGDLASPAAGYTAVLFISYWVERIVPGIFKKVHGQEIYDYEAIDRFARLIGSRMNNNVWFMLLATLFGFAQESFYIVSMWMLATAAWHTYRLATVQHPHKREVGAPQ